MSEQSSNICKRCGGVIRVEYTMTFERCMPQQLRVTQLDEWRLCPGHDQEPRIIQGGDCWSCGEYGTDLIWWHAGIYGDDGNILNNQRMSYLIHKACIGRAEEKVAKEQGI